MTKSEFLSQLTHKLRALPESDQRDALDYYEGYISDAHDESEAIRMLGGPSEVAATILSNYVSQNPKPYGSKPATTKRGKLKTAHIALLAIFAVPIGIPLAAAAFGLIVGLLTIIFSVAVTGIALLIAGVWTLIYAPAAFINDFWFGVLSTGLGFASIGFGILALKCGALMVAGFPAIVRFIRRRRNTSEGDYPVTKGNTELPHDPQYSNSMPTSFHENVTKSRTDLPHDPQYSNSLPLSSHESYEDVKETLPRRRRIRPIRLAILLVFLGALFFGIAWLNGARGGVAYWEDGRFRIESTNRGSRSLQALDIPGDGLDFHTIMVSASSSNVVILPTDGNLAVYAGTPNAYISITDGVLNIRQRASGSNVHSLISMDFTPGRTREIRLYLPAQFNESNVDIEVQTTSGNILIEGDFANLTASATSGRIQVRDNNHIADTITLRTTSGRIAVDNISHANEISATATSGRITITNINSDLRLLNLQTTTGSISAESTSNIDYMNARATSGRVRIANIGDISQLNLQTTTGSISAEGITYVSHMNARSTSGRINLENIKWSQLEARATSGRINISRGSINILPNHPTSTQITATSGAINLDVDNNQADFSIRLVSSSGSISIGGNRLTSRGVINLGSGDDNIEVQSTSGRIRVDFTR